MQDRNQEGHEPRGARCPNCCSIHVQGEYCPSPAEIAAACLRFQANWTDSERARRLVADPDEEITQVSQIPSRGFRPFVPRD